jgi:RNA polymerase sigma-70 factor (ECF subfamily)
VSELARAHTYALAGVARREGLGAADALDAVQVAFHTLLRLSPARTPAPGAARAALVGIVRNVARNMRRRHHRALPHTSIDDVELATPAPTVDELIARAQAHLRLRGCVDRLGAIQREIVTLRVLEEVSGPEVAARLALPAGHVAVLLHRAKRRLARCISD